MIFLCFLVVSCFGNAYDFVFVFVAVCFFLLYALVFYFYCRVIPDVLSLMFFHPTGVSEINHLTFLSDIRLILQLANYYAIVLMFLLLCQ